MLDLVILGGGLSGLALARQAQQLGSDYLLLEARERLGGRILSQAARSQAYKLELGPSWLWPQDQPRLAALLNRFGIALHEQYQDGYSLYSSHREAEPQAYSDRSAYQGAFRVDAGFGALVNCLAAELEPQRCLTGQAVKSIYDRDSHVEIHGLDQVWQARQIALCLPPRLIAEQLKLVPELDERLLAMMQATPTWMAGHAKVIVEYQQPFWRAQGLSGNALAGYPGAVLAEIFDLCSSSGEYAALGGFSGWPAEYRQQYRDDIPDLVLDQLVHLFGPLAANPLSIQVQDWATETATASALDQALLREHPDYGHAWFQLDHWNDKLYFGGTETAKQSGGYLEGALVAAERIAKALATSQLFAPGSTDILASPSNSY